MARYRLFAIIGVLVVVLAISWLSFSLLHRSTVSRTSSARSEPKPPANAPAKNPVLADASTKTNNDGPTLSPKDREAMAFVYADDRLQSWLDNWTANHDPNAAPDPSQLKGLKEILDQSPLSAGDLMTVAHGYDKNSGAPVVASQIYRAAANKMDRELAHSSGSPGGGYATALAFTKNRQNIKDVLWPLIQNGKDPTALNTLCTMYSSFIKYNSPKPKDSRMRAVAQAVRIGLAECLSLKGDPDAALVVIQESAADDTLGGERRIALEWAWCLAIYTKKDFAEVLPHLDIVLKDDNFKDKKGAHLMRIEALAKSGRLQDARNDYEAYLKAFHPSFEDAVAIASDLDRIQITSEK